MNDMENTTMIGINSSIGNSAMKMPHSHSTPAGVDGGSRTPPPTPKKAGKMLAIRVQMLDDSITMFQVQAKALGRVLFDQVCKQLHLLEADYFGLEYQEANGTKYWLDLEKPVCRQVGLSLVDPLLRFCVKFYTPDPAQLEEEFTRYLFCSQIKRDLAQGLLQCNDNTAALMASYIVQAECGDYVIEDYPDHTYLSTYKFIPHQDQELERRIMENHKRHAGQSPAEADLNLLETARRCELYGMKMHPAKDHEGIPLNLAVAHMGIVVFQNYTKINTFSWAKIRKISFKRKRFLIKLHPEGYGFYKDTVEFFFDGRNECKNFWKKCVENHGFFRCSVVKRVVRQKTRVLSRGSSFRYSGKTQKQIVEFVRDNYVKRQTFQRSNSFRQTSGGRALQGLEGGGYRGATSSSSLMGSSSISAHPLLPLGDPVLGTPALSLSCGSMTLDSPTTVTSASMGVAIPHREDTATSFRTLTSIDVHSPGTPNQDQASSSRRERQTTRVTNRQRNSSAGRISPSNSSPPEFPEPRPMPRHSWQRSASCRELNASSFEDSGKTRAPSNQLTSIDHPVTRYDETITNCSYSAASSKLPSLDHDSLIPDRVYSSSYPGTSSMSTESGHEESAGQIGDLSHEDLSHDSYELLEREQEFEYPESFSSPKYVNSEDDDDDDDDDDDEGIEREIFQMDIEIDSFVKHKKDPLILKVQKQKLTVLNELLDYKSRHRPMVHVDSEILRNEGLKSRVDEDSSPLDSDCGQFQMPRSCTTRFHKQKRDSDLKFDKQRKKDRTRRSTEGLIEKFIEPMRRKSIERLDYNHHHHHHHHHHRRQSSRGGSAERLNNKYSKDRHVRRDSKSLKNDNESNKSYFKRRKSHSYFVSRSSLERLDSSERRASVQTCLREGRSLECLDYDSTDWTTLNLNPTPSPRLSIEEDDTRKRDDWKSLEKARKDDERRERERQARLSLETPRELSHSPVERTISDPNPSPRPRLGSNNSKRHVLMHQKSIDLTPADSGEEDPLFEIIETPKPDIPYTLHKRHVMNGTATNETSPTEAPGSLDTATIEKVDSIENIPLPEVPDEPTKPTIPEKTQRILDIIESKYTEMVKNSTIKLPRPKIIDTGHDDFVDPVAELPLDEVPLVKPELDSLKVPEFAPFMSLKPHGEPFRSKSLSLVEEKAPIDTLLSPEMETKNFSQGSSPKKSKKSTTDAKKDLKKQSKSLEGDRPTLKKSNSSSPKIDKSKLKLGEMPQEIIIIDSTEIEPKVSIVQKVRLKSISKSSKDEPPLPPTPSKEPRPKSLSISPKKSQAEKEKTIFGRGRLGLSEGSGIGILKRQGATQSPSSQRRAKSLDAPIISLHKLPPINSFSSKDDTLDAPNPITTAAESPVDIKINVTESHSPPKEDNHYETIKSSPIQISIEECSDEEQPETCQEEEQQILPEEEEDSDDTLDALDPHQRSRGIDSDLSSPDYGLDKIDDKTLVEVELTPEYIEMSKLIDKKFRLSSEEREDPDSSSCSIARPLGIGQIQPILDDLEIATITNLRNSGCLEDNKPLPIESSGSSSFEEGSTGHDDIAQSEDSFQEDFPNHLIYPIGTDLLSNYAAFSLSRTLSRISERSTTSEQDKSDIEDSFKPSSRSPSLDDESIMSSDRQPSLSSDPPSGAALPSVSDDRRTSSELPDIPIDIFGPKDEDILRNRGKLMLQSSEDWPSPPSSPLYDSPPIVSHVETYYMEIKAEEEEAVKVHVEGEASGDSSDENHTLQDDLHSTLLEDAQSSISTTTVDGTIKIMVKPKSNSHVTGSSHSEDTSMGLSMSEWSSSNNTVRQFCQYSGTKSDDNSLAELGASISDWSGSTTVVQQRYPTVEKSLSDTTTSDKSFTSMRPNSKCQFNENSFPPPPPDLGMTTSPLSPPSISYTEEEQQQVFQCAFSSTTYQDDEEEEEKAITDDEFDESLEKRYATRSTERPLNIHNNNSKQFSCYSTTTSLSGESTTSSPPMQLKAQIRTKTMNYPSSRSPQSEGDDTSSSVDSPAHVPPFRRKKTSQIKRRHRVVVDFQVKDGQIVSSTDSSFDVTSIPPPLLTQDGDVDGHEINDQDLGSG